MARGIQKLSALKVGRIKAPGYSSDGAGLWLQTSASGAKSWIFRFMLNGRAREMGLGPLHTVGLADARVKAGDARKLLLEGLDPIEARNAAQRMSKLAAAKAITFDDASKSYIATHRAGWKNAKHISQWESTLKTYASPAFGALPISDIDTGMVMKCLESIWATKTETASRVRGRIESILDWATVRGYRTGDNPARWKGHLDHLLPARTDVQKVEHHPALSYSEIGNFFAALREQEGIAAKALEFTILTAARTGEVIGTQWDEIDFDEKIWTIPETRMKAKREHRVPLCPRAFAIVKELRNVPVETFVFRGRREGSSLSNMAMLELLKRMGRGDLTVHGFRSTFRDWAAERTNYPRDVAEMALAHAVGDKVEAAYRRGDLFDKRRRMMQEWQKFCETPTQGKTAEVVPLKRVKK